MPWSKVSKVSDKSRVTSIVPPFLLDEVMWNCHSDKPIDSWSSYYLIRDEDECSTKQGI